ncbi:MAG: ATP-binding protein [Caldilineales bacterium]|nr:ATP-binding protein [Caldilineales bacterium]
MDDFSNPDQFFESIRADAAPSPLDDMGARLGQVISGSLSAGLEVRLDRDQALEDLAVGRYVVIRSRGRIFFGMVTDIALDNANPAFEKTPPDVGNAFLRDIYLGTSIFGRVHISPMLVLDEGENPGEWTIRPVKTVPGHYAPVATASAEDVGKVFGEEGERRDGDDKMVHFFHIGRPLDMENVKITLNLDRLVERSSAVFGKSGTGKTFLSRLLLAGIIQQEVAVNLIFDMHNEYGWEGNAEHTSKVKGLKQLFPGKVSIFTLDDESSRRRGSNPDFTVTIPYESIEPEDVEMLAGMLDIKESMIGAMDVLYRRLGKNWLRDFLNDDWIESYGFDKEGNEENARGLKALADDLGQPSSTLAALRRRFIRFNRYQFVTEKGIEDSVSRILQYLEHGQHVVLEFGRWGDELPAYVFVANYLTRRIREIYRHRKEQAFGEKNEEPTPLVITIEEAHKFLEPGIAAETIFGTIARELRKYNVTLFIVDQRPSGIDPEVMSQVGTRVTLALDSEEDIRAVFMGVAGAQELRQVLAKLDTKEQALILGHAVPMPVVVQTRKYNTDFYALMGYAEGETLQHRAQKSISDLSGKRKQRLT